MLTSYTMIVINYKFYIVQYYILTVKNKIYYFAKLITLTEFAVYFVKRVNIKIYT